MIGNSMENLEILYRNKCFALWLRHIFFMIEIFNSILNERCKPYSHESNCTAQRSIFNDESSYFFALRLIYCTRMFIYRDKNNDVNHHLAEMCDSTVGSNLLLSKTIYSSYFLFLDGVQ